MLTSLERGLLGALAVSTLGVALCVAAGFLNPVGTVLLWVAVAATLGLVGEGVARLAGPRLGNRGTQRLLIAGLCVSLLLAELVLRFGVGRYENYFERNRRNPPIAALPWLVNYRSPLPREAESWYRVYPPEVRTHWTQTEFVHERRTNTLGLTGGDVPASRAPGEIRVVVLGDSFVEGVGAGSEDTWVKVMERTLGGPPTSAPVRAVNAGVAGSDPFFDYVLLRDRLLPLTPDLVIVSLNHSDVLDVSLRGGFERFRDDGRLVVPRSAPAWEWLYALSHLVRHGVHDLLGYDRLLMSREQSLRAHRLALERLREVVTAFATLGKREGIPVVFLVHPFQLHVERGYPEDFEAWAGALTRDPELQVFDALAAWQASERVTPENVSALYWKHDLHHNAAGYRELGLAVADWLRSGPLAPALSRGPGSGRGS